MAAITEEISRLRRKASPFYQRAHDGAADFIAVAAYDGDVTLDPRELAAVFTGGFVGTAGRAELAEIVVHDPGQWPVATFVANIVAAGLLGYVTVRLADDVSYRRPLLGAGLCGGLSTFATLQIELLDMLDGGHGVLALGYAAASLAAGLLALALATTITRRARPVA